MDDTRFMDLALARAEASLERGDWPVAALVVRDGQVIGEGENRQNTQADVTIHAETAALRDAFARTGSCDLSGATLYTTMEPCPMCAWAMKLAGIGRLVLGARHADLRRTDMGEYAIEPFCRMTGYRLELVEGVRNAECVALRRRWGRDAVRRE